MNMPHVYGQDNSGLGLWYDGRVEGGIFFQWMITINLMETLQSLDERCSVGGGCHVKEHVGGERSDIRKWKKKMYFETINVIPTAAALSWITLLQRFQTPRLYYPCFHFQPYFSTNATQFFILFTICLADRLFPFPKSLKCSSGRFGRYKEK